MKRHLKIFFLNMKRIRKSYESEKSSNKDTVVKQPWI